MADFASPEWIEELARAAETLTVDPEVTLTVEQRLTGTEPIAWHIAIADGHVRVTRGPATEATVTLTSSIATAGAIHAGELSSQRAFLDGALQIGGDLNALISHRDALVEVAALLGPAI